jgi:hypothetical protein
MTQRGAQQETLSCTLCSPAPSRSLSAPGTASVDCSVSAPDTASVGGSVPANDGEGAISGNSRANQCLPTEGMTCPLVSVSAHRSPATCVSWVG